jgi:hypothetical protein
MHYMDFKFVCAVDVLQKSPKAQKYLVRLRRALHRVHVNIEYLQAFSSDRAATMLKAANDLRTQQDQDFVKAECTAHTLNNAGTKMECYELSEFVVCRFFIVFFLLFYLNIVYFKVRKCPCNNVYAPRLGSAPF